MDAPPQPRTLLVDGAELTYLDHGEGDTVVFVHGALGDYRDWLEQLAPIAGRYRVVAYSRRGHYPNAWPADYAACEPAVHAADLAALIDALGLGPAHLFGHSYGALVSLVLACRQPALVRSLVLGEPPLLSWLAATPEGGALAAAFMADTWEPARRAYLRGDPEAGVRAFFDGILGAGAFDRCPPPIRAAVMDNAEELRLELATPPEAFFSAPSCADVARLEAPALLLVGASSPPLFWRSTDELARCLPRAELAVIPGASHDLWNPPLVGEAVLGFLAKH